MMIEEDHVKLEEIINPIDTEASDECKAIELHSLSNKNHTSVSLVAKEITNKYLFPTQHNVKSLTSLTNKARRPEVREKNNWFRVEHVRDALRFRAEIQEPKDLASLVSYFIDVILNRGCIASFVKVETGKMLEPKGFGWRMAAFDFRHASDQLIEFYFTFPELLEALNTKGHEIFEKWRNTSTSEIMTNQKITMELQNDLEESLHLYQGAWYRALDRMSITEREFIEIWEEEAKGVVLEINNRLKEA